MTTLSQPHDAPMRERVRNLRRSQHLFGITAIAAAVVAAIIGLALLTGDIGARFESYEAFAADGVVAEPDTTLPATTTAVGTGAETGTSGGCKAYSKEVLMGGETQTIHGTACQQPDGTWDIVQ